MRARVFYNACVAQVSLFFVCVRAFMEGTDDLVSVDVADKDANYLRTQLNKRIEARAQQSSCELCVITCTNVYTLQQKVI